MKGKFHIWLLLALLYTNCSDGLESQLEKRWVLKDIEGELATDEFKALMKLDTILLDLQANEAFDGTWYSPEVTDSTVQDSGIWYVVPDDGGVGKLVLEWNNGDLDRVIIGELTETRLVLPLPYGEHSINMIFEAEAK